MRALIVSSLLLTAAVITPAADGITVSESAGSVAIANRLVRVVCDLTTATYSIIDARDGTVVIAKAHGEVDGLGGNPRKTFVARQLDRAAAVTWTATDVSDALGSGTTLTLRVRRSDDREYATSITLHGEAGFVTLGSVLVNRAAYPVRVRSFQPLAGGDLLPGSEPESLKTLNGGAGSTDNLVKDGADRACENSLLVTALVNGRRRSVVVGGLSYQDFAKYAALGPYECWDTYPDASNPELGRTWRSIWIPLNAKRLPADLPPRNLQVAAVDPVGRLVDAGATYQPDDLFYVDVTTADPFVALESYGKALRTATGARPNPYDTLTVCGWFSHRNTSAKLVGEMEVARRNGMLNTIPVSVRLEPDTYCGEANGNTEQGWWDDAHWRTFGHLVAPYDTFASWIAAVHERGGTTETYFQCGMPSDDYALAFPGHMLRNDISALHRRHTHVHPLVTYDATDGDFQRHMRTVWADLRKAGLGGVKFDYPDIAWRPEGGFEDVHATTASAYRAWFQLCRDGLGPQARIHERALGYNCLDVTAGIVDLQRVWSDSDRWEPGMSARCGLRWYKNRVVMGYYPDSKSFTAFTADGRRIEGQPMPAKDRRTLITLLYVTSGRIESAGSLELLTPEVIHDLGRAFPMHRSPQSARPLDAFTGVRSPRVYAFRVDDDWQQVTFTNEDKAAATISAPLSGESAATGALGLDPARSYYVYEFWSDRLVGRVAGNATLSEELAAGETRMYAVRAVLDHPQVLSTNRHLMQGYVELADIAWDSSAKVLSGTAAVVGGEPFRLVLARNGGTLAHVTADGATARLEAYPGNDDLCVVVLERPQNGTVAWRVTP